MLTLPGCRAPCKQGLYSMDKCTSNDECCSDDCTRGYCKPSCAWFGCDKYLPCCGENICIATGYCCAPAGAACGGQTGCCAGSCEQGICVSPLDGGVEETFCSTSNGNCDPNATCGIDGGFQTCDCNQGWEGDGLVCVQADADPVSTPGPDPCGAPTPVVDLDSSEHMAVVSAGPFWRGCNLSDDPWCVSDEFPGECITLSAYEIDQTEVAQGAYESCVLDHVCTPPTACGPGFDYQPGRTPDLPMACVSWDQANAYCQWAGGGTKRLPTEAEWEKAARGVDGRVYPWGNQNPDSEPDPCNWAIYGICPPFPQPVGTTPHDVSPFGAQDMVGNVWEWVSDWYDPDYYAVSPTTDPQGPAANPPQVVDSGSFHVYRGGGIGDQTIFVRTSNRFGGPPGIYSNVGFRCARSM